MQPLKQYLHETTYCHCGTEYREATHIWTNSSARVPLRRCRKDDPCGQVRAYGKHPVVAQAGASKDGAPGMSSGDNIPLDLTTELLWQPMQSWSAQDAGSTCLVMAVLAYEEG
jgi:hypothetical protein